MGLSSAEYDALVARLMPTLHQVASSAVLAALANADRVEIIAATISTVDGPDGYFLTDDNADVVQQGTRMHPDIVEDSRVLVVKFPPAGVFLFGPIPDT